MGNIEMSYLIYKYLEILLTDIFIDFLFNSMMSKNLFVKFQFTKSGSSLEAQWVKDRCCHCYDLGHSCGMSLSLAWEFHDARWKKKKC